MHEGQSPEHIEYLADKIRAQLENPPAPIAGSRYVPKRTKDGFRWESLAVHYFHGDTGRRTSLANAPTRFGELALEMIQEAANSVVGTSLEGLAEDIVKHEAARGLASGRQVVQLTRAYVRYVERMMLGSLVERLADGRTQDVSGEDLERARRVMGHDFGEVSVRQLFTTGTGAERFSRLLRRGCAAIDVVSEGAQEGGVFHPMFMGALMQNVADRLQDEASSFLMRAEVDAGLHGSDLPPVYIGMGAKATPNKGPKRKPDPCTVLEHEENRAYWLVRAKGYSLREAARSTSELCQGLLNTKEGNRRSFGESHVSGALNKVGKLLARFGSERDELAWIDSELLFLIHKTLAK